MKKLLAIGVLMALCVVPAGLFAAQSESVDKGSVSFDLGPAFGFVLYTGDLDATAITILGGGPYNVSYFIIDNLSIGGTFSFDSLKVKGSDALTDLTIGPEVNYYLPLKDKMLLDIMGQLQFTSSGGILTDPINQLAVGGGASVVYLFNKTVGVYGGGQILLGFDAKSGGTNVGGSYFSFGAGAGLKMFL